MRSVFNKSEYRRLKHRPVKIIQTTKDHTEYKGLT